MSRKMNLLVAVGIAASVVSVSSIAGITVYKDGEKYLKVGGRIQLQYHDNEFKNGSSDESKLFFRRFRPYIEGSLHKDWKGKFQWDMGKADLSVKDAYMQYKGFNNMKVTVGNANFPFSREFLTSSKKQQLVERSFVGDHNYGTPDRQTGIHLTGHNDGKDITWGFSAALAALDPDQKKLDFDTVINNSASDWNEGWMVGGRIDFHPFGKLKFSQGDFKGEQKATIGVAAFTWSNDGQNNTAGAGKPDVDQVNAFEISGAYRNSGFSIDAEYNSFSADTVTAGYTGGIFKSGSTKLVNYSLEGGYMIVPAKLELVAAYQVQDADNYASEWARTSVGVNWFIHKHDIKLQTTYRMGENENGVANKDGDEVFVQAQYVF